MIAKETELYPPIKHLLEGRGYRVAGEAMSCDLAATRKKELLIVEMKRAFNLDLIFQGIQRQAISPLVYLAIEEPRGRGRQRWRKILRLCRMLGLGLMTVRFNLRAQPAGRVEVLLDPGVYKPRINTGKRSLLLKELQARSADYNIGGSVRSPIVTAYREEALRIARQLKLNGPSKVGHLAQAGESKKTGSILLKNYYGWFERVSRGMYGLTSSGGLALATYAHVI